VEEPHLAEGKLGGFMAFTDDLRSLKVLANADSAADARTARRNGAEGIGLCRTEHMVRVGLRDGMRLVSARLAFRLG
jgi:phosphoenolpyruvate synthase/pyruvate phosphate dikinase